jgi:UDP-N-acetylmuramyl tripeptide synthase
VLNGGVDPKSTPRQMVPEDFRLRFALVWARVAVWVSRRVLGRTGGVIGGRVLAALAPGCGPLLAQGRRVVVVSGTNGKSTCTALVTAAWATAGSVNTNTDGSNTSAGLLWTMATATAPGVVLEVDEAWVPWAIRTFGPEVVVLLNLARDQLHRNPEVGLLANAWREAVRTVPTVVANADDPWVVWAAETARSQVWVGAGQIWSEDSLVCPACGDLLDRTEGWTCSCGRSRPTPTWNIEGSTIVPPSGITLSYVALPGVGNVANAAMALAAATGLGAEPAAAMAAVSALTEVAGRYSTVQVGP